MNDNNNNEIDDAEGVYYPSTLVRPTKPPASYIKRADRYFNQLESKFTHYLFWHGKLPSYAPLVARWEWPPNWYRLTGFRKNPTIDADTMIRDAVPCICVNRTHIFCQTNPFARSVVTFYYGSKGSKGTPIYIYEEFTFNDLAQMTFIEAWSITEEGFNTLTQLAQNNQPWPDRPEGTTQTDGVADAQTPLIPFTRLSTKIPGLGLNHGEIEVDGDRMNKAARQDPTVGAFQHEAHQFELNVINEVIQRKLDKLKTEL